MQSSLKRIATGTLLLILTIIVAVAGYLFFGWTLLEAIYMVVITIFGVGYGEVNPLETAPEKIFTILVIIAGTPAGSRRPLRWGCAFACHLRRPSRRCGIRRHWPAFPRRQPGIESH